MPYKKKPPTSFIEVARLLKGYDINAPALAELLGCSAPTARRKLNSPELLTLKDIGMIAKNAHVPMDEIRQSIKV